jgi:protein SMG6
LLSVPNGTSSSRKSGAPLTDEPDEIPHHPRQQIHRDHPSGPQRQLFDPRKDDPVRFQTSVFSRPTPVSKGSVDTFVSASSTSASSYAHSIGSSFTLTSNSTGTSGSSSGSPNAPREEGEGGNAFVFQLKKLYREITALEGRLITGEIDPDEDEEPRFTLQARTSSIDTGSDDKYLKMINDHKGYAILIRTKTDTQFSAISLADMMQRLMNMTLAPQVPTSVHSISSKYNIPTRLWGNAFDHALQTLRKASASSNTALEHLNDFIFWAYSFYTSLVEDPQVESFRGSWLEALGDLARYRMAVASFNPSPDSFSQHPQLSLRDGSEGDELEGSANPSVGAHAAQALEIEPESEQWRQTARRWYAQGLQDTPGTGKLHHHLGLLSRDVKAEELRAVYHFTKRFEWFF